MNHTRRARILLTGVPVHLIQRGNRRSAYFYCLFKPIKVNAFLEVLDVALTFSKIEAARAAISESV